MSAGLLGKVDCPSDDDDFGVATHSPKTLDRTHQLDPRVEVFEEAAGRAAVADRAAVGEVTGTVVLTAVVPAVTVVSAGTAVVATVVEEVVAIVGVASSVGSTISVAEPAGLVAAVAM